MGTNIVPLWFQFFLFYCFGYNEAGQLGNGYPSIQCETPVRVMGLDSEKIIQIAAGGYHSCAVTTGGVYCFGRGSSGQLGYGYGTIRATPVTRLTPGSHRSEEGGAVDGDR